MAGLPRIEMDRPRSLRLPLAVAGGLLIALAASAACVRLLPQVELPPSWGVVPTDAMVAFALHGIALIACAWQRPRIFLVAAAGVLVLTGLSLVDGIAALSPGDGRLSFREDGWGEPMTPGTALAQMLASALLFVLRAPTTRPRRWALGLGYTVVFVVASVPLLGYVLDIEPASHWPGVGEMAAPAAFALMVSAAVGFTAAVAVQTTATERPRLTWLPVAVALGSILLSGFLFQAHRMEQDRYIREVVAGDTVAMAWQIEGALEARRRDLQRMANLVETGALAAPSAWQGEARELIAAEGYRAVARLGPDLRATHLVTRDDYASGEARRIIQNALRGVGAGGGPVALLMLDGGPRVLGSEDSIYVMLAAVTGAGTQAEVIAAVASLEETLHPFLQLGYGVRLAGARGNAVHRAPADGTPLAPGYAQRVAGMGPGWVLEVTPSRGLVDRYSNALPVMVFIVGAGLGLAAAALLWMRELLRRSHEVVHELNETLAQKVDQRTSALLRAVSEREQAAANLAHVASHDNLTGLPNNRLFREVLTRALVEAEREGHLLAVMLLDLDNFKDINDSLGHSQGDHLLKQLVERLRPALRQTDTLARQGGDEFLVLAADLPAPEAAADIAEEVLQRMRPPFDVGGADIHVSISIGITLFPQGEAQVDAGTLVRQADAAMYQAKASGRGRYEFYSTEMQRRAVERLELRSALIQAIERDELDVYYQPRVNLETRQVVGAEALARWRHPQRGSIPPDVFVGIAEETGLINALGRTVLQRVCRDLRRWEQQGLTLPQVSVNASSRQFQDQRLLEDVSDCLRVYPGLGRCLELELTERALVDDLPEHRSLLHALHRKGIRIAIDDFGTGCSSFAYFRQFPIDIVKIDKSFIQQVEVDINAAMITQTITDLARNFRLGVVAEGIETEAQSRLLRKQGCDEGQGYLFGWPMPADEFMRHWRAALGRDSDRGSTIDSGSSDR